MKKILFATTALVATAGVAAAEVAVSGSAEIGVIAGNRYNDNAVGVTPRDAGSEFWTDVEVVFTMTGEADNGLTFGAKVDLDEGGNAHARDDDGATWFLAFGGARLDMGDTDGAFDWALQEVNVAGGSIDDSETWQPGFNGNSGLDGDEDGQVARFTYTFDGFSAAVSAEVDDAAVNDPIWGVGFKYSGDLGGITLGVGLGYQTQNDVADIIGVSVDGTLDNGLSFAVNYSELDPELAGADTVTHWGIGFGYTMNALTVGLNYGEYDNAVGLDGGFSLADLGNNYSSHGYGLVVNYDFGGGLVGQFGAGVGEQKMGGATTDFDSFSLGLAMSF
ncbi:porin [Antarctobacter jejuensis]|uniref:porin n=1 Tax=Antarctobacter jejuensis TaxID=1439938 RepID=UPI003FD0A40F